MLDFGSFFQKMGSNLGGAFQRAETNISHPLANISSNNLLYPLVHGGQADTSDPWAGMRTVTPAKDDQSKTSRAFQMLGSMSPSPAPMQAAQPTFGAPQANGLSQIIAQMLQSRGGA